MFLASFGDELSKLAGNPTDHINIQKFGPNMGLLKGTHRADGSKIRKRQSYAGLGNGPPSTTRGSGIGNWQTPQAKARARQANRKGLGARIKPSSQVKMRVTGSSADRGKGLTSTWSATKKTFKDTATFVPNTINSAIYGGGKYISSRVQRGLMSRPRHPLAATDKMVAKMKDSKGSGFVEKFSPEEYRQYKDWKTTKGGGSKADDVQKRYRQFNKDLAAKRPQRLKNTVYDPVTAKKIEARKIEAREIKARKIEAKAKATK